MREGDGVTGAGFRFVCGAGMAPGVVLAAWPGARFVARAWVPGADGAPVWGILLAGAGDAGDAPSATATTDDGREFEAAASSLVPEGDAAAVLAAARYWELPPAYVRTLAGWVETADTA